MKEETLRNSELVGNNNKDTSLCTRSIVKIT